MTNHMRTGVPMILVSLVVLLTSSDVLAGDVTLGIAFMVLSSSTTINTDPFSATFAPLSANYSDVVSSVTRVQPGWVQGMQMYRDLVNAAGGFTFTNSSSSLQSVQFKINFFPVARTTDSAAVQLSKMLRFMNDTVLQQRYGPDYVMISAPPILTGVPTADIATLANFCETYAPYCILLSPTSTDPTIHICTKHPVTGLLPADCIARNRKSGRRRFDRTITTAPPSLLISDLLLQRLLVSGMQRVAILRVPSWTVAAENAKTAALSNGQTVVFDETYNPANVSLELDYWVGVMTRLKATNPQGLLVYSGFATNESLICENVMLALKTIDFYPGAVDLAASCGSTILTANRNPDGSLTERGLRWRDELSVYSYGVLPWDTGLKGPDYRAQPIADGVYEPFEATDTMDSPAVFTNALLRRFPTPFSAVVSAQAVTAPLLLQKAVEIVAAYPWDAVALAAAMQQISQPSHHGPLSLDVFGRRKDTPYPRVQVTGNGTSSTGTVVIGAQIIIAPPLAVPIYPTPNWSDRVYKPAFFANGGSETVFVAVAAVAQGIALMVLLGLVWFRDHKVIRAATLSFCIVMVCGCMIWMSTIFLWGLHENDGTCMGKVWTMVIGWVAINVPLMLKTYRLGRIFNMDRLTRVDLPTKVLFGWLGATTIVTAILLGIWSGGSPLTAVVVTVDPYRPALNYTVCSSDSPGWIVFFIVILSVLLLANGGIAFWTRNIPAHDFNESSKIAQVVYLNGVLAMAFIPAMYTITDRNSALLVRSIGILGVGLVTLLLLFVTKFIEIWHPSSLHSYADATRLGGTPNGMKHVGGGGGGGDGSGVGPNTVIRITSGHAGPHKSGGGGGTNTGAVFSRHPESTAAPDVPPPTAAMPTATLPTATVPTTSGTLMGTTQTGRVMTMNHNAMNGGGAGGIGGPDPPSSARSKSTAVVTPATSTGTA